MKTIEDLFTELQMQKEKTAYSETFEVIVKEVYSLKQTVARLTTIVSKAQKGGYVPE